MENQPVKWTIMAYINADNILANFAVESLKQLRNAASENVVVIAEFDDNQQPDARVYLFNGDEKTRNAPLEESLIPRDELAKLEHIRDVDMTRPETLTEFIDFASEISATERYCLILWGHGIELLLDEDRRFTDENDLGRARGYVKPGNATSEHNGGHLARYLSAKNLGKALAATKLAKGNLEPNHPKMAVAAATSKPGRTLDIIGLDACSMSMIEIATVVQEYADFMIASQEDVPDASFPYERILEDLENDEEMRGNVTRVCERIPQLYKDAFRDYIATPNTGVKGITLASLNLGDTSSITGSLAKLSTALLHASCDPGKRKLILSARQKAKDFVFGILVDLGDFCECLEEAFAHREITDSNLLTACAQIQDNLKGPKNGFVLANEVSRQGSRCHGVSVYLPFRDETDATDNAEERFFKGSGAHPTKGSGAHPTKERLARIQELEADFWMLKQFRPTGWMEFVKRGWSLILASEVPLKIDYYYSAEQCAANLTALHEGALTKAA